MSNSLKKNTVLVVDDSPENIALVSRILGETYRVKMAISGEEALKIATGDLPDLILLDVMMPGMDGYEVCKQLKSNPWTREIPVMFLTAMDQTVDEQKGFDLGAVDYITKPVRPSILKARLNTQLSLRDQNLALETLVRKRTHELREANKLLRESHKDVISRLGRASELKDYETGYHVIRVGHYSRLLAKFAGMSIEDQEFIELAAPMHDIGKIGIPDMILLKQDKLSEEEWNIMRRHPEIGADLLAGSDSPLLDMARTISLTHHENWDGSGYPRKLKGEDIPLVGRIVTLADVFDALTMERPYKKAWSDERSFEFIESQMGRKFDPKLAQGFVDSRDQVLEIKNKYMDRGALGSSVSGLSAH